MSTKYSINKSYFNQVVYNAEQKKDLKFIPLNFGTTQNQLEYLYKNNHPAVIKEYIENNESDNE